MRIIFFNIWQGQVWDKLQSFVKEQAENTDIFCFMEVGMSVQEKLIGVLPGFKTVYDEGHKIEFLGGVYPGQSVFIKNKFNFGNSQRVQIYEPTKIEGSGLLFSLVKLENRDLLIGNVHGIGMPGTKNDTPARIKQSETIINYFKDKVGPKIIGGDFNLNLDTESVAMFEKAGYRNLIKDFNIKTTRNKISWEQFGNIQYFADFCFVSEDVKVKNFAVPNMEASDHEPLILDFEI